MKNLLEELQEIRKNFLIGESDKANKALNELIFFVETGKIESTYNYFRDEIVSDFEKYSISINNFDELFHKVFSMLDGNNGTFRQLKEQIVYMLDTLNSCNGNKPFSLNLLLETDAVKQYKSIVSSATNQFLYINELIEASDEKLLSIRGLGKGRLKVFREFLKNL